MTELIKIVLLLLTLRFIEARSSSGQFAAINDCTCQGYNSTYECTVFGGAATVWKGTGFECSTNNEVVIFHSTNSTSQRTHTCNDGAITVRIITAGNDSYTSQLTVQVSNEINGTTVVCAHDSGEDSTEIGSALLNTTTVPFPPPTNVQLVEANHTHLIFNWSQVSLNCPSIHYHIMASNCGQCPHTTTNNVVTCNGNYTHLLNDWQCSFAVQTVVCDDIVGDISMAGAVNMTGPGMGFTGNKSLLGSIRVPGATVSSSIIITLGTVIVAMFVVIVFITSIFTAITATLIRSKQALRAELELLKVAKMKEQPIIPVYEEIAQLQDSLKSSSPTIDTGENTAYVSAFVMNACARTST